jgi:predicted Fe-S protein YdhL (DUF1289 family)
MDNNAKLCIGCWRTIDEIVAWGSSSDDAKRKIRALIALRKNDAMDLSSSSNLDDIDKTL